MRSAIGIVTKLIEIIVVFLMASLTVIVFSEVIMRFLFDTSLAWTPEFARYSMVWITFLGSALALRADEHIRVTFFLDLLKPGPRRYGLIAIDLVLLVFLAALLRFGYGVVQTEMTMTTAGLGIPFGYVAIALPVASVLMIVYLLADIGRLFRDTDHLEGSLS